MCSKKRVKLLKHTNSKGSQLQIQACNFTENNFLAAIFLLFYQHFKFNFCNTSNGIFNTAICWATSRRLFLSESSLQEPIEVPLSKFKRH